MTTRRYRVAQWATGDTGKRALREVIRHPAMDLVGVLTYNPGKDGVDAGDLCGEPPTGIKATTDRKAVQSLGADCVVYMPRATGTGVSRAGLTQGSLSTTSCRCWRRARTSSPRARTCWPAG
jgi:4-hydroxy-tetrahydrodipicolinate reductase